MLYLHLLEKDIISTVFIPVLYTNKTKNQKLTVYSKIIFLMWWI